MKLKVLSFNIHKGFNWNNSEPTLEKLKLFLESANADIVFLQEVVGENVEFEAKYSKWMSNQFEYLADSIWNEYAYAKNAIYDGRHHGNVILSKYPIVKNEQIDISTNSFEQRGVLFCEINCDGEKIHCYNLHLNLTHHGRKKQYQKIQTILEDKASKNVPIIMAGDFNDWNQKASEKLSTHLDLQEAHYYLYRKYAKTFPAALPVFNLDRIYTFKMNIEKAYTLRDGQAKKLSDHLPYMIEVEL